MLVKDIVQKIKEEELIDTYTIKKIILFGSRATNTHREDSDVDLIIEFTNPVTLLDISKLRVRLEELLNLKVDIIHGPLPKDSMIELTNEIVLFDITSIR